MTRRFRVTIGGVTYNVDVEELGQAAAPGALPPAAVTAPSGLAPAPPPAGLAAPPPAAAVPPAGFTAAAPAVASPTGYAAPPAVAAPSGAPAAPPAGQAAGEGLSVCAPLPGMVVEVKVAVGQQVREGDVVAVLEAMKMENDITSPYAGTVKQVLVEKGASVGMSDPLVVIG